MGYRYKRRGVFQIWSLHRLATKFNFLSFTCPGILKSSSCFPVSITTIVDGTKSYVKRRKKEEISQTSSDFNHYDLDSVFCSSDTPVNCFISNDERTIYVSSIVQLELLWSTSNYWNHHNVLFTNMEDKKETK